jgi:tRNA-specific 2-thiouridylase
MLWAVPADTLAHLEFPLGGMTKTETRAAAERAQLPPASEPESQEVCFAVEGYQRFLEERGVAAEQGPIVTRDGVVIGTHEGQWRYTIGQRRGLNVSAGEPLYVLERSAAGNVVVAGPRDALLHDEVELREVLDRGIGAPEGLEVQLRYRSPSVPIAGLRWEARGRLKVLLEEPFAGAAAGQSAVFYRGDVVVGGGLVAASGAA